MTAPPELDELVERVLAESHVPPTPARELFERARRRREWRRRATVLCTISAITVVAGVVSVNAIGRRSGQGLGTEPSTSDTAQALIVTCGDGAIHVDGRTVEAQPDGVHLRIRFPSGGGNFSYTSPNHDLLGDGSGTGQLSPGPWNEVFAVMGPGPNILRCGLGDSASEQAIEVIDPHGYWRPLSDPSCPLDKLKANGEGATPADAVRSWLAANGHADSQLAQFGYPSGTLVAVGVLEDGNLVARVPVVQLGSSDTWRASGGVACASFSATLRGSP